MTYLPGAGGVAGALVLAAVGAGSVVPLSQPVSTAPITIPNNTINVNVLFIVSSRFTISAKRTSTILA